MPSVSNYYQNHRRYVNSIDTDQLLGAPRTASQVRGGDCKSAATSNDLPIYPCGLIANSLFNGEASLSLSRSLGRQSKTSELISLAENRHLPGSGARQPCGLLGQRHLQHD